MRRGWGGGRGESKDNFRKRPETSGRGTGRETRRRWVSLGLGSRVPRPPQRAPVSCAPAAAVWASGGGPPASRAARRGARAAKGQVARSGSCPRLRGSGPTARGQHPGRTRRGGSRPPQPPHPGPAARPEVGPGASARAKRPGWPGAPHAPPSRYWFDSVCGGGRGTGEEEAAGRGLRSREPDRAPPPPPRPRSQLVLLIHL